MSSNFQNFNLCSLLKIERNLKDNSNVEDQLDNVWLTLKKEHKIHLFQSFIQKEINIKPLIHNEKKVYYKELQNLNKKLSTLNLSNPKNNRLKKNQFITNKLRKFLRKPIKIPKKFNIPDVVAAYIFSYLSIKDKCTNIIMTCFWFYSGKIFFFFYIILFIYIIFIYSNNFKSKTKYDGWNITYI